MHVLETGGGQHDQGWSVGEGEKFSRYFQGHDLSGVLSRNGLTTTPSSRTRYKFGYRPIIMSARPEVIRELSQERPVGSD